MTFLLLKVLLYSKMQQTSSKVVNVLKNIFKSLVSSDKFSDNSGLIHFFKANDDALIHWLNNHSYVRKQKFFFFNFSSSDFRTVSLGLEGTLSNTKTAFSESPWDWIIILICGTKLFSNHFWKINLLNILIFLMISIVYQ